MARTKKKISGGRPRFAFSLERVAYDSRVVATTNAAHSSVAAGSVLAARPTITRVASTTPAAGSGAPIAGAPSLTALRSASSSLTVSTTCSTKAHAFTGGTAGGRLTSDANATARAHRSAETATGGLTSSAGAASC